MHWDNEDGFGIVPEMEKVWQEHLNGGVSMIFSVLFFFSSHFQSNEHLKLFKNIGWKFLPLMDQILPDTVPCGGHAFAPSLASPPTLMNMETIDKLTSVDKDSAILTADNQGSTTLVGSSNAGALKAVGHKGDNDLMQIDDINVSSHVDDKCLPPG